MFDDRRRSDIFWRDPHGENDACPPWVTGLPIIYNETPYLLLPGEIDYCLLFPRQRIKFHACKSYGFNIAVAERFIGMQQITLPLPQFFPFFFLFFFLLFWSSYLLTKLCFSASACRRATIHFQPSSRTCFQTYTNIASYVDCNSTWRLIRKSNW